MTALVTGHKGFIGQNVYNFLKVMGKDPIGVDIRNAWSFLENFNKWDTITEVYHLGAISDTRETDLDKIYNYNIDFSRALFEACAINGITVKTASSASVYGNLVHEVNPLNYYSLSKLTMDYWIEEHMSHFPLIQSFRFFNVYGEGEEHKVRNGTASPVSSFIHQAKTNGVIKVFEGSEDFMRDFVCVRDVVSLMVNNGEPSGVYDLGTSHPISFQMVAELVSAKYGAKIKEVPFPKDLDGKYQIFTSAKKDFKHQFITVRDYLESIHE
jgi:ADP-L-glycero-D-manno-heptose 6-epimerase|tara:strand:+ start:867 stop:1673 length:807 start_codon:yes stop_codon:yes gene_type:complete